MSESLSVKNLTVSYGEKKVLENFCADFSNGKITVVLGASGVGKSTVLNAVAGLVPYQGEISGNEGGVSYIFQNERLIPSISVYKNLDLVLKAKIKDKKVRREKIENVLENVELLSEIDSLPTSLSGGMAQRVSMARGFLYPADVLLMDEAFKGLDTALKSRLISAFVKLFETNQKTVVFVTHSIDEALLLGHKILVVEGKPASVSLELELDIPLEERRLTDERLDKVRKVLLAELTKDTGKDDGNEAINQRNDA